MTTTATTRKPRRKVAERVSFALAELFTRLGYRMAEDARPRSTIAIAWVEDGAKWDGIEPARDLGERPRYITIRTARACRWLNDGSPDDLRVAREYAAKSGGMAFAYPTTEPDPIACAKADAKALDL